jgi:CspA family cold shock protein
MARSTVKWFNSLKGYGFIRPQSGGKDVNVHISAFEKADLSGFNEGQVVEYEEVPNKRKDICGKSQGSTPICRDITIPNGPRLRRN